MGQMKLAFLARGPQYLAFKAFADAAAGGTRKYDHVELVFSDEAWFTSEPLRGVGFEIVGSPGDYDYWVFVLPDDQEEVVRAFAKSKVGDGYNWGGYFPRLGDQPGKEYCSEICCMALQQAGYFNNVDLHCSLHCDAFFADAHTAFPGGHFVKGGGTGEMACH